jgi:tetratricopeptide (TPR) repeat protein
MMVFTAETFGMPKIVQALKLWGEGKRTPEVIRTAFGLEASEYDSRYRAWQKQRLARFEGQYYVDDRPLPADAAKVKAEAAPRDAKLRAAFGLSLLHEHKVDEAKAALDQALKLDPKEPTALYLTARIALASKESKDPLLAATKLALMIANHQDGYPVQLALAEVAEAKKDKVGIRRALEAATRLDPSQPEPLKGLLQLAEEEKREDDAIDILGRWAMLDQHDRKIWRTWLHRLVDKKRWAEAARVGESALFVDVESGSLHVDYAHALSELGQHAKASFELESATLCNGPPKDRAAASVLLAKERLALKDPAGAKAARDAALRLDHDSAEAKALEIP